jgi:hypothetical protein
MGATAACGIDHHPPLSAPGGRIRAAVILTSLYQNRAPLLAPALLTPVRGVCACSGTAKLVVRSFAPNADQNERRPDRYLTGRAFEGESGVNLALCQSGLCRALWCRGGVVIRHLGHDRERGFCRWHAGRRLRWRYRRGKLRRAVGRGRRYPSPARAGADHKWEERCRPTIAQDRYGVPRYQYAAPGCEFGIID